MAVTIEQSIILLVTFLFPPIFSLTVLVTILAIFGKSLGIRKAYVKFLVKIFEWATHNIKVTKQEDESDSDEVITPTESVDSLSDGQFDPKKESSGPLALPIKDRHPSDDDLIRRDATELVLRKISRIPVNDGPILTVAHDALDFIKAGFECIIDDEVTSRFKTEELNTWNLLTRSSQNGVPLHNWKLTLMYVVGFIIRYLFLLPGRLMLLIVGITWLICSTAVIGFMPEGSMKKSMNWHASLMSHRILSRAISAIINHHNSENRGMSGGICVANHTSPIDVIMLACDNCYAYVGQSHGGFLGVIQRALSRATSHIWFERSEANDRAAVARRLREHVHNSEKLPILIFPEGTCINNSAVMQFKKGSFEVGGIIYPVAMKYDPRFGDPFWNSSLQSFLSYVIMMMTSWAIVCDIYYLPAMTKEESENSIAFASKVKAKIAEAGGLVDLEWDGQLKRLPVKEDLKLKQQLKYSRRVRRAVQMMNEVDESDDDSTTTTLPPQQTTTVPDNDVISGNINNTDGQLQHRSNDRNGSVQFK